MFRCHPRPACNSALAFIVIVLSLGELSWARAQESDLIRVLRELPSRAEANIYFDIEFLDERGKKTKAPIDARRLLKEADPEAWLRRASGKSGVLFRELNVYAEMIRCFRRCHFEIVLFQNCRFERSALVNLSRYPQLNYVSFSRCIIPRVRLSEFSEFPKLQGLTLLDTYVYPGEVAWDIAFPQLEGIYLERAGIGDKDMLRLSKCAHLTYLEVRECPVTDDGTVGFVNHPKLRRLRLHDTDATYLTSERLLLFRPGSDFEISESLY